MLFLLLVTVLRNSYPTISITVYLLQLRIASLCLVSNFHYLHPAFWTDLVFVFSCLLVSYPFALNSLAIVVISLLLFSSNTESINIFQFEKHWSHVKWPYLYSLFSWLFNAAFFFFQLRGSSTFIVKEINQSFVTPNGKQVKKTPFIYMLTLFFFCSFLASLLYNYNIE